MARTKNVKRARVEGESSASTRLIASSHYMARWLPSPRTLNNYVEKFESRAIVPPRAVYSTLNYVFPEPDEEGESLQYENPHIDARGNISCSGLGNEQRILMYLFSYMLIPRKHNHGILFNEDILVLWAMVTGKEINWPYFMVHHMLEMKKGKSSVGLGYACHWTKIFTWLGIDLGEEKSVSLSNVAKIDDNTLRQMGSDSDAQEPQSQGQPQDPEVQA
ncbi:uncharacterized protein DS421_11g330280 [Arachis hypogaea]|nr:uncharacterized protein DS421_11g330280 [Arachis hypogaea]